MAEVVISDFAAGHPWIKSGVPGTVSDDTVVYKFGTQSLKLVTDGAAGECKIRWTLISPAINMTGKFFKLWVRINNVANLNRIWLYAYSTAYSAGWTWKPSDAPSHYAYMNDTWIPITFSFGQPALTGAPNRASVITFQLYAQDKNATPVQVNWGGLHSVDEVSPAHLTFSFDDGYDSTYTQGAAKLATYGFPGVVYVCSDLLGTAGFMTQAQLDAIYAMNWDVAGHYQTNLDLVGDVPATLAYIQAYLSSHGYSRGVRDFAYPGGVYSPTILGQVQAKFRSARTIIPYAETQPAADMWRLRNLEVADTTTPATIAAAVTRAINNKEWLILTFHRIVTTPSSSLEYAIADFQTVVDNAVAQGIAIKTISGILDSRKPGGGPSNSMMGIGAI